MQNKIKILTNEKYFNSKKQKSDGINRISIWLI